MTFTAKSVAQVALPILRDLKTAYAEWEAECEQDRRNGYRPHYCFHGTDQWTDYDNICGGCEDGSSLYERAVWEANSRMSAAQKRTNAGFAFLRDNNINSNEPVWQAVVDWAMESIS